MYVLIMVPMLTNRFWSEMLKGTMRPPNSSFEKKKKNFFLNLFLAVLGLVAAGVCFCFFL